MKYKLFSLSMIASLALCALPITASAATYPANPVTVIVGAAPGGPTDTIARVLAQDLAQILEQSVVVSNKPGANSLLATHEVARARPDGYTLLLAYNAHIINKIMTKSAQYDPLKDFAPVSMAVSLPMAVVVPTSSAAVTINDIVDDAKANPEKVSYGSSGNGGAPHLAGALLEMKSGAKMIHVPYKGNAPALLDVIAGRVNFMFYPMVGINKYVDDNRVRIVAVTSDKRHPDYQSVPSMSESGFEGFEQTSAWIGMFAPAGTPADVVERLNKAVKQSLSKETTIERLRTLGAVPAYKPSSEFAGYLANDLDRWSAVIQSAGIETDK